MSGDSHKDDDQFDDDFLDEDFVVEDIVGKNDDLEDLFTAPGDGPVGAGSDHPDDGPGDEQDDGEPAGDPGADDLLFTDHTEGIEPTEQFAGSTFAEDKDSEWNGEQLDLDEVGEPETAEADDERAANPELAEATESFTDELDAMLHEEEFSLDGDEELELVDAEDGISEFEQSGPFILEDGDGEWSESLELDEDEDEDEGAEAPDTLEPLFGSEQSDQGEILEPVEGLELDEQLPALEADPVGDDAEFESAGPQLGDSFAEQGMYGEAETVEMSQGAFGDADPHDGEAETVEIREDDYDDGYADDAEELEEMPLLEAVQGDEAGDEELWEPLPSTSMDQLSEIDEVQRQDDDEDQEEFVEEGFREQVPPDHDELDNVDGHDIYADEDADEEPVVIGGGRRGGAVKLLLSLAASALLLGGAATVVVRPQWFGLSIEPERVDAVELRRPTIDIAFAEPPAVAEPGAVVSESETDPATGTGEPTPSGGDPAGTDPATGGGDTGAATGAPEQPADPAAGATQQPSNPEAQPLPTPWEVMAQAGEQAGWLTSQLRDLMPKPAPQAGTPTTAPTEVGQPVAIAPGDEQPVENSWPVAQAGQDPKPQPDGATDPSSKLTQFGPGILVGGIKAAAPVRAIEGVMPGSRAFAQLNNGNYFIGKVKQVADRTITLRMDTGEVTIATAEIAQLTRLDSQDYDELQKVTKGFVRLTNNNRLVGGILSKIADDHVVLEFRKNRVILPKSAIGEIVPGQDESRVRLGVTDEEDDWLRSLAERQLGTGKGADVAPHELPNAAKGVRSNPPR